jgi:hypothetical protein
MAIRTEISLRLQNSPGALAGICQLLSDEGVNILAIGLEGGGLLRLLVDNHLHAAGILAERHFQVDQRDVLYVTVPNEPGALARVGRLLAGAGVNVEHAYGSAVEGGRMAALVVGVADAQRASAAAGV